MFQVDRPSHLMQMITVTGRPEIRCAYGAPWRVTWSQSAAHEIPCHIVLLPHGPPHDRLMCMEPAGDKRGGYAILNALTLK
jgi:AraC family transcriptional activator of mtrCDE